MATFPLKRCWVTSLDPMPKLPHPYGRFSNATAIDHKPGHWLILGVNKNIRGSSRAQQFPNARIPGAYAIFEFDGIKNVRKISDGYNTPHEANQAIDAIAPILGETQGTE